MKILCMKMQRIKIKSTLNLMRNLKVQKAHSLIILTCKMTAHKILKFKERTLMHQNNLMVSQIKIEKRIKKKMSLVMMKMSNHSNLQGKFCINELSVKFKFNIYIYL